MICCYLCAAAGSQFIDSVFGAFLKLKELEKKEVVEGFLFLFLVLIVILIIAVDVLLRCVFKCSSL